MNHNEVVRQKLTERYLLAELDQDSRDQFEEHFFECPECALDVQAGAQFVDGTRVVLAESSETFVPQEQAVGDGAGRGWFSRMKFSGMKLSWLNPAFFRPAFALPTLAVLLSVIGYQNLVTYPKLLNAVHQPRTLPWLAVAVGSWGSSSPTMPVPAGSPFLLFVRIPPDGDYVRYTADLYNPAGRLECSLNIPVAAGTDRWPVLIPGAHRESGSYRISVRGVTAAGETKDLGGTAFTLEIQK